MKSAMGFYAIAMIEQINGIHSVFLSQMLNPWSEYLFGKAKSMKKKKYLGTLSVLFKAQIRGFIVLKSHFTQIL
jgi:hypothetical protein